MTRFKELAVGDSFDWISPNAGMNSFYRKCRKISARRYRDDSYKVHTVGSANAEVYHVNDSSTEDGEEQEHRAAVATMYRSIR